MSIKINSHSAGAIFSEIAKKYSKYRVTYPEELYDYLSNICFSRGLAWDCATGNGQVAYDLKKYFNRVIATDISVEQLKYAKLDPKIVYYNASCENSLIEDNSIDLVTVACAAHWFNLEKFEQECSRVCNEKGIMALWWLLGFPYITKEINAIINTFYQDVTRPYFNEIARRYFEEDFKGVELSFNLISHKKFKLTLKWNYFDLIGYFSSMSFVQNYLKSNKYSPIQLIEDKLKKNWGNDLTLRKEVSLDILMKTYRK
ncbi:class I SAM-dependent methyltransferase [Cysteiniphilum halobium]|uniref:class I SAM-dependent methyltransferase n=1 Tax=Cysteiniphilum halobium TaxID=2219059 RepID=UPI000E649C02|nr:class I SAM-dependent methyltransferase [Cysteiniphilum halobium]